MIRILFATAAIMVASPAWSCASNEAPGCPGYVPPDKPPVVIIDPAPLPPPVRRDGDDRDAAPLSQVHPKWDWCCRLPEGGRKFKTSGNYKPWRPIARAQCTAEADPRPCSEAEIAMAVRE